MSLQKKYSKVQSELENYLPDIVSVLQQTREALNILFPRLEGSPVPPSSLPQPSSEQSELSSSASEEVTRSRKRRRSSDASEDLSGADDQVMATIEEGHNERAEESTEIVVPQTREELIQALGLGSTNYTVLMSCLTCAIDWRAAGSFFE